MARRSIILAVLVSLIKPTIVSRYFVPLLAPASILLAIAIIGLLAYRLTAPLALLLIAGLFVSAYWTSTTVSKPDWRGIAAYLSANATPEDAILVAPANNDVPLRHYFSAPVQQITQVRNSTELPSRFTDAADAGRIWTVTADNEVSREMMAYAGNRLGLVTCRSFGSGRGMVDLCLYSNETSQ